MTTAPTLASSPPAARRAVDLLLDLLAAEDIRTVFGIPGGLIHPLFEAAEAHAELQVVLCRHEEGAAFMADGYARTSGRMAVCAATSGPGATNLMTGVACAYADGVPLLALSGQAARHAMGRGAAQEMNREDMDVVEMFRPITKYSAMVATAEMLPHHVARALRCARSGRPGPVHLNVPVDIWGQLLEPAPFASTGADARVVDLEAVERAVTALARAHYPVILAGSGVAISRAQQALHDLAASMRALVATTPRAKGVFDERHPRSLGVLGFAGQKRAREVILGPRVDVLLSVGASLNETTTFAWHADLPPSDVFIQSDIDPQRIGRNYPADISITGDASTVLNALLAGLQAVRTRGARPSSRWKDAGRASERIAAVGEPHPRWNATPVIPQRWRADLMEVLPENALIFSDIGGHMLFNLHHLTVSRQQRFVLNLGFGSMGHGTVAPIGAAFAQPDRPIIAIVGDGCFAMNGMELLTAVEHELDIVWLIENNHMHGVTWHGSRVVGEGLECVRYRRPLQVTDIARALGLQAYTIDSPGQVGEVVLEALCRGGPTVLEILVDPTIAPPLQDRARSVAGFIRRRS